MSLPCRAVQWNHIGWQKFVFVVKQGVSKSTLEKRLIQVGIADATNYEVISGSEPGRDRRSSR